jgi:hypothetical protein
MGCVGVRVNTVAPGGVASSGFDTYPPEVLPKLHEYASRVPMQRYGTEAEISAAILFLLSPAAAYITGFCIRVDGGAPNARATWRLEAHERGKPFEGFHRASMPNALGPKRENPCVDRVAEAYPIRHDCSSTLAPRSGAASCLRSSGRPPAKLRRSGRGS